MAIVKATISDAEAIHKLISYFAEKKSVLPRPLNYIYENIRDFWVAKQDGEVVGCSALHVIGWEGLAEVKSLTVSEDMQKKGLGRDLVNRCIEEGKQLGASQVFALTFVPEFFVSLGFSEVDKESLPHKIWSDCIDCSYFPDCKEIAVKIPLDI